MDRKPGMFYNIGAMIERAKQQLAIASVLGETPDTDLQGFIDEYNQTDFHTLPEPTKAAGITILRQWIPDNVKLKIREAHAADPENWYVPYHFSWGMAARNALRQGGLLDDQVPSGNWDDYYVELVECAVGVRP